MVLALLALAGGDVRAEMWKATPQLVGDNTKLFCPNFRVIYEFTLADPELIVKTPAGQTQRGTIGADGKVAIVFKAPFASVGIVTISGDARAGPRPAPERRRWSAT